MRNATALGMHIYAGGFTLGVRKAGFDVLGHLEEWNFGVETSRQNLCVEVRTPVDAWKPEEFTGRVDWLYANPPCASFSGAGVKVKNKERNTERWKHDGRTQCTELCFSMVPVIKPKVFTWECVMAATKTGAPFVAARTEDMIRQGYHVYHVIFNCKDVGLPQERKRFFFVGSKVRLDFERPTHKPVTVREAWAKMKDPGPILRTAPLATKILKMMDKAPQPLPPNQRRLSKFVLDHWKRVGHEIEINPTTGHRVGILGFLHERLRWDFPAPTVMGGGMLYHPSEPRILTVLEQQLLCGYPLNYKFVGGNPFAQIGKAVTPTAGYWLAKFVKAGVDNNARVKAGLTIHNYVAKEAA